MAVLPNKINDEEQKKSGLLKSDFQGSLTSSGGGGSASAMKPGSSGSFTNMQSYIDANKDQSRSMTGGIIGQKNEEISGVADRIGSQIAGIGQNKQRDYSTTLGNIQRGVAEIGDIGGSVKNYGKRFTAAPGSTKGQKMLNNFILGSPESQQEFATGIKSAEAFQPNWQQTAKNTAQQFNVEQNNKYNEELAKRDSAQQEIDQWMQGFNDKMQGYIDNYNTALDAAQKKQGNGPFGLIKKDAEMRALEQAAAQVLGYRGEGNMLPSGYGGYSYTENTDISPEDRAALEALNQLGAGYDLSEKQYNIDPVQFDRESFDKYLEELYQSIPNLLSFR